MEFLILNSEVSMLLMVIFLKNIENIKFANVIELNEKIGLLSDNLGNIRINIFSLQYFWIK